MKVAALRLNESVGYWTSSAREVSSQRASLRVVSSRCAAAFSTARALWREAPAGSIPISLPVTAPATAPAAAASLLFTAKLRFRFSLEMFCRLSSTPTSAAAGIADFLFFEAFNCRGRLLRLLAETALEAPRCWDLFLGVVFFGPVDNRDLRSHVVVHYVCWLATFTRLACSAALHLIQSLAHLLSSLPCGTVDIHENVFSLFYENHRVCYHH